MQIKVLNFWRQLDLSRKLQIIILLLVGLVTSFLVLAWISGQHESLLEDAHEAWKSGRIYDAREYALVYIEDHPESKEALALLIHVSRTLGSPDEVKWRQAYWEAEQSYASLATYVECALYYKQNEMAQRAVVEAEGIVSERERLTLEAFVSVRFADLDAAVSQLETAFQLSEEVDDRLILNLSTLIIKGGKDSARAAQLLGLIEASSPIYLESLRAKLSLHGQLGVDLDFIAIVEELLSGTNDVYSVISALDVLVDDDPLVAKQLYHQKMDLLISDEALLLNLCLWGVQRNRLEWTLEWIERKPRAAFERAPLCWVVAGVIWLSGDKQELDDWLDSLNVTSRKTAYYAVFKLALGASGFNGMGDYSERQLLNVAGDDLKQSSDYIHKFSSFAKIFKLETVAESIYWRMTPLGADAARVGLGMLYENYAEAKDTKGLYRVMNRMTLLNPSDKIVKNNLAALGLLLGEDMNRMHRIAESLIIGDPENPTFLSTAAFSAYKEGNLRRARELIERIDFAEREVQPILFYNLLILNASGDINRVKSLIKGLDLNTLLPEEYSIVNLIQESL